eukprot:CAMPEP_0196794994 /NCGR_PEP_ID=MMETSP1104-20130614/35305_1 /TAXON_ID=33652 /ORGANISM="Cafeteria sp., Strain Caron Lab Isolate" /LENGTH=73 /DNA_ID=CAMNT_0042165383 /DNA_START=37 /DNA_END=255 /DNA_ORIENTATION=+
MVDIGLGHAPGHSRRSIRPDRSDWLNVSTEQPAQPTARALASRAHAPSMPPAAPSLATLLVDTDLPGAVGRGV